MHPTWQSRLLLRFDHVTHGVSTRTGGVSLKPYDSMNIGLHTEDQPVHVIENRKRFLSALDVSLSQVVAAQQVHGSSVAWVTSDHAGRGALSYHDALPGIDAMATDARKVALLGYFADCLPVLVVAGDGEAVGLAHAGWRGTVAKVVPNLICLLGEKGWEPRQLSVALGPCIKPCCFEVNTDVEHQFRSLFGASVIATSSSGRPSIDLAEANRIQLLQQGVSADCIEVSPLCTSCRSDMFFSHRRDRGQTGRIGAVIMRT